MSSNPLLQFVTFSSAVEATFWHTLSTRKIDLYKLDDTSHDILGYYSTGRTVISQHATEANISMPAHLCLGTGAFDDANAESFSRLPPFSYPSIGKIKNTNTIEDFKSLEKTSLFKEITEQIWQDIISGEAIKNPCLITRFLLVTFADLKKYKYHYWFGFPALLTEPPWNVAENGQIKSIGDSWESNEIESFRENYDLFRQKQSGANAGFFLVRKSSNNEVMIGSLSEWDTFFESCNDNERIVGFADPSSLPMNPGWPLRNLLVLLQRHWNVHKIKVLCYREIPGKKDISQTRILTVEIPETTSISDKCPKSVGWEKNPQGKLGPRSADLAPLMDPTKLADTSVDLNLKLMRWRIVPDLQLEKIRETKCLLLGAGTLGCYVARCLLGWGVRHITFVDNARVSFSNPIRQPLFFFEDCLEGGKPKAQTAAENLKKVYPGVITEGHDISIPMPGHPITSESKVRSDVEKISQLVESHDVVFLLMDSRESRWLPTMLGASMRKLVINTALGFDTYVVMRHGVKDLHAASKTTNAYSSKMPKVEHLGCYFCNDIVAPTDSLKDRTLDQQCTVTRPGLSAIAGAYAVELMVSVLHHEKGPAAPADTNNDDLSSATSTPLGIIPHQIRGFLTNFNNMLIIGQAYDKCTACSDKILEEYKINGYEFLKRVFDSSTYLEELTGLAKLHQESEAAGDFDWDEEDTEL
ncbi:14406_t:CDS:10 [Funneliformis caledonium]|uniref:Ubiquitin-like modifier-activating enzyme ATG7 n=1 Tax=Funneliformis caledonium TaxID=1117310 RepID=A0A9N9A468_9GLOM|nr:14406_t:CDS:10 [Funneliformis caledonium]